MLIIRNLNLISVQSWTYNLDKSREVRKSPPLKASSISLGLTNIFFTRLYIIRVPFILRN